MSRTHRQETPARKTYPGPESPRSSKPNSFTRHVSHKKNRHEGKQLTKRYTTQSLEEE